MISEGVAAGLPYTIHAAGAGAGAGATGIVYLHGGGLLYGDRNDLPQHYIDMICDAGYTLICLDYPLAPEYALPQCIEAIEGALAELTQAVLPAHGCSRYVLFGRSSGAYLALLLAKRIRQAAHTPAQPHKKPAHEEPEEMRLPMTSPLAPRIKPFANERPATEPLLAEPLAPPAALWCFYGYYDLAASFISQPCKRYAALPRIDGKTAARIAGAPGELVTNGPKSLRFSLYIHARQLGTWNAMLGLDAHALEAWSLTDTDLALLPPTFVAASTGDADVPFSVSKHLARTAPHARMFQAYDLEHDFDRDVANPAGSNAYAAALAFLEQAL